MSTRPRWAAVLPIALLVAITASAAAWWLNDSGEAEPVDIAATGPRASSLGELVDSSDLVVEATVVAIDDGRAITDPNQPGAGIRTQLARFEVADVLAGELTDELVVEQESALLDGTPVTVNGLDPLRLGDSGFFFLIRGTTDEFPYSALVGDQGWMPVVGDSIQARRPLDPIGSVWDGRDRSELVDVLQSG